jgi:hypothetical protein
VGIPIGQPKTSHHNLAPWFKEDMLQFEGLPDTGRSVMVQGCLDAIPEFAHRYHIELAVWFTLRLIEIAYEFQGSAIRVQQFLPARENQNTGLVPRRVIQWAQLGSRLISASHL